MNSTDVAKILDEVSSRLSGPAQDMFHILVRQYTIIGIVDSIVAIILLFVSIGASIAIYHFYSAKKRKLAKNSERIYDRVSTDYEDIGIIICIIVAIIGLSLFLACGVEGIFKLNNPQYYAIKEILYVLSHSSK